MSTHRRHLITRKADGFFWCRLWGWQAAADNAVRFDSLQSAYAEIRDISRDDSLTVEPADWYLPDSTLRPLEFSA